VNYLTLFKSQSSEKAGNTLHKNNYIYFGGNNDQWVSYGFSARCGAVGGRSGWADFIVTNVPFIGSDRSGTGNSRATNRKRL